MPRQWFIYASARHDQYAGTLHLTRNAAYPAVLKHKIESVAEVDVDDEKIKALAVAAHNAGLHVCWCDNA
jgi:hypothetical protein